ncbi:LysR family transcriptional regulator [Alteromonadaceae bacterium M269]|nr:LysR family transcriptional regulator [Alteromonadaceae bacterium M269]
MQSLNWDDLRFFLALSRHKTATHAGIALGVNHTTIARRASALEETLKTRLFERSQGGFELTQAGENLLAYAVEMEELTQSIDRDIFGRDSQLSGPLKITIAHDVAERLVLKHIKDFHNNYPHISLELLTTTGLVNMTTREADIALRLTPKPPEHLVGKEITRLKHGIYTSSEYWEKHQNNPSTILYFDNTSSDWVKKHFPEADVAMRVDDVGTMCHAVANHMGIARLPCYVGDTDSRLRRLDIDLPRSTWGIWILNHIDLRSTARVRAAREFLIDIIEKQLPLIHGEQSMYM